MKSILIVFVIGVLVLGLGLSPVFAELPDKLISSNGNEYEFSKITEERKFRNSSVLKIQGYTTTGETFFYFSTNDFEKILLLADSGWQKATLIDKPVVESITEVIPSWSGVELHYLIDQYDRVYNKADYKLFIKTFDKSIYSGDDFQNFQGKVSGAKVSGIILDSDGDVIENFEGYVENGVFEGSVYVEENIWERGWYTVDIMIEYEGKFYPVQTTFYVYGEVVSGDGLTCPPGQTKVNGVCQTP